MARRNKKNRMVIESLEQRLLLAGDPAWNNNTVDHYDSPVAALNMSGHYKISSISTEESLSSILSVEMRNANGSDNDPANAGWDIMRVNQLTISAKKTGSYSIDTNGTASNVNDDKITHDQSGRYTIRLKSIGTLTLSNSTLISHTGGR